MAGVNKIIILGNLGKDPEVRYTPNGMAVAKFSVATTERIKNEDKTEWHNVIAFARLAEICGEYLAKGRQVYIEGRLQTRSYEDRDGNKRYVTEIICNTLQMLGKADGGNARNNNGQGGYSGGGDWEGPPSDDEIPF